MRGSVAGSTRLRIVRRSSSGSFPTFAAIRRVSSLEMQLGGGLSPRLVLERPSLTVPAEISTCAVLLSPGWMFKPSAADIAGGSAGKS